MNDKIMFIIRILEDLETRGGASKMEKETSIFCYSLEEINKNLKDLEKNFLSTIPPSVFIKEILKEEWIVYRNELGIEVQGTVNNYIIKNDFLEYLIRLCYLEKHFDRSKDLFLPFYTKKITVKKYLIPDIEFQLEVCMQIYEKKLDNDV
jgi:hypothetical protein